MVKSLLTSFSAQAIVSRHLYAPSPCCGRQEAAQNSSQEVVLNTLSEERCQNQLPGTERIYESCLGFSMNRC